MPDDKAPSDSLPPAFGIRLTGGSGLTVAIPLEPVPPLPNQTTSRFWLASETATARLAPGVYRVSAIAGQTQLTGWRVEPGEFQIVAPVPTGKNLLSHLRIHRSVLLGKTEEALTAVNQLTSENANDAEAWIAKGDIHLLQDQPAEALDAYDRALNLQKDSEREPIAIMVRRSNAFTRSLEKRGVIAPPPP
jgi:tetratricopeptide (TPR) repeat protein